MPRPRLYRPTIDAASGLNFLGLEFYTNSSAYESFYVYNVGPGKLSNLVLSLTANASGQEFAYFKRDGIFYNQGAGATRQNGFQSTATDRTLPGFDVRAMLVGNLVLLQAKAPTASATHWEMVLQSSDLSP